MRTSPWNSGILLLVISPAVAACAAVAGWAAPRPTPPPPTPLPSAVPPQSPPRVWALPLEYEFGAGFWALGRHSYRFRVQCEELGYVGMLSTWRHFSVFDDVPGEARPLIYLRQFGLSTTPLGLLNRAYIHPDQPTVASVVFLGLSREKAEQLAASSACSATVTWDDGIGTRNLVAGEPYLP